MSSSSKNTKPISNIINQKFKSIHVWIDKELQEQGASNIESKHDLQF